MSTPSAVRTNPGALPGYVLSEPLLSGFDAVEEQINREYEARYIDIHSRVDQRPYDQIAAEAEEIVLDQRPFRTFSAKFNFAVDEDRKLAPWVLWACLERRHPTVTIQETKRIIHRVSATGAPEGTQDVSQSDGEVAFHALWNAAKQLFFDPPKNVVAASITTMAAAST